MREPIHPGKTLRDDLAALELSAAELARHVDVPVSRITEILNGRRSISRDMAFRLGRFLGTSGEFWLNLQKLYEQRLAERKKGSVTALLRADGVRARLADAGLSESDVSEAISWARSRR